MSSTILSVVSTGILSGGFVAGVAQFMSARVEARKLRVEEQQAADAEGLSETRRVSLVVEAAERSVTTLNIALNRAEQEIARLERTIAELKGELATLRQDNTQLSARLHEIQNP